MITREFSGKTKEEVISNALETLKLSEDQIEIEFKDESSILPFKKKQVTALISFEEENMFGNRCLMFIKDLLEKMNIEAKIYLIEENDEKVIIELESPDIALIIGRKGQTLESIQTIVNAAMNKKAQTWTKVIIDIGNYRNRRERNLNYIAHKAANQVRKTKQSILLEPMNPFERRIVHLALKEEEEVETKSEGDGIMKEIRINYLGE